MRWFRRKLNLFEGMSLFPRCKKRKEREKMMGCLGLRAQVVALPRLGKTYAFIRSLTGGEERTVRRVWALWRRRANKRVRTFSGRPRKLNVCTLHAVLRRLCQARSGTLRKTAAALVDTSAATSSFGQHRTGTRSILRLLNAETALRSASSTK